MSAINPDPDLTAVERWLRAAGELRRESADPVRCAPASLVSQRRLLARFYFRRLFPGLPGPCLRYLEDLAVRYMLEPERYA